MGTKTLQVTFTLKDTFCTLSNFSPSCVLFWFVAYASNGLVCPNTSNGIVWISALNGHSGQEAVLRGLSHGTVHVTIAFAVVSEPRTALLV